MLYFKLFSVFFKIGLFSFGGGLSMLPLIEKELERNHWMSPSEFLDVVSLSQMTPGPIAINSATYIGLKVGGIPGALAATLGTSLPSIIIILLLSSLIISLKENNYKKAFFFSIRPVTTALILYSGVIISRSTFWTQETQRINLKSIAFTMSAYFILSKYKLNPTVLIFFSAVLGILIF